MKVAQNEKKTTWIFFLHKYRKFWSVSSEFKLEHKIFILEVCSLNIQKINGFAFWRYTKFEICNWIYIFFWMYSVNNIKNVIKYILKKTGEFQKIRSFLLKFVLPPIMPAQPISVKLDIPLLNCMEHVPEKMEVGKMVAFAWQYGSRWTKIWKNSSRL